MKKWIIWVGSILILALSGCDKNIDVQFYGQVKGVVLNTDQEPIANATVSTSPASSTVLTDSLGAFLLDNVPVGEVIVTAKKTDYATTTVAINVIADNATTLTLVMANGPGWVNPAVAITPTPANGAVDRPLADTLRWQVDDAEDYTFDVLLYGATGQPAQFLAEGIADTFVAYSQLAFGTRYLWQVVVKENAIVVARSDLFAFTTEAFPDHPFRFVRWADGNFDVFSADSSGAAPINLTVSNALDRAPRLSTIRDRIAFTANSDGATHIYTMLKNGSAIERVTPLPVAGNHSEGYGFCWSPNSAQLLFCHYDKLMLVNRDGSGLTQLATAPPGRHFKAVDWNGVTRQIIVQTSGANIYDAEFYLMNEDGSNWQLFIANDPGRMEYPSFSITGDEVLFTRDESGFNSVDGRQLDSRIYLLSTDSTGSRDLSINKPAGTNDLYPRFSPDGAYIIFVNTNNTGIGQQDIYIMDRDGLNRRLLFPDATMPDWH